ncbi:MAG: hypothetical protein WBE41_19250, partial [Terracidiphilus sp.]
GYWLLAIGYWLLAIGFSVPDRGAIRNRRSSYLPWQQLSVQPFWQQVWPQPPWQQFWQLVVLAAGACAIAVTARTTANEINASVRFICFFSLTVFVMFAMRVNAWPHCEAASKAHKRQGVV